MSTRSTRWLLFLALFLALPLPMLGPFDAWVPAVRFALLFAAAGAVAWAEGAAGPVPAILALLGAHAAGALLLTGAAAWLGARALEPLSPAARRVVALSGAAALIAVAVAFELYRTPFGRAPTANLFGVLS